MTIPFEYPLKFLDIAFESPVCPVLGSHFSKYSTNIGGTGEFCCVPLLFFCHDLKIIPFFFLINGINFLKKWVLKAGFVETTIRYL